MPGSLQLGLGIQCAQGFPSFDPLSLNPILAYEASRSMMAPLASESLDLDPANPSSLDVITATRAGTATYTDASGNIQTASPNTVRVDHVQGAELTPTKSQLVGYTDFSSGWVQGGLTISDGEGLNGEVSKVVENDDAGSGNAFYFNVPTVEGQTYTGGFWIRRISGSGLIALYHTFSQTSSQVTITNDVTSEWTFVSTQFLGRTGGGLVRFGVRVYYTSGDSVEIAMPQVEEGTVATSFIPTSGSAVTRNGDTLKITGSDFTNFYNTDEGTFYVEFTPKDFTNGEQYLLRGGDGNRRIIYSNGSLANIRSYDGANVLTMSNNVGSNVFHRIAVSFDSTTMKGSLDGATEVTSNHSGNLLTSTRLEIGTNYIGHIKRLIYWPHHSDNL